jgi:predicted phosphohydrolase
MIYAIADLHLSFENPKPMDIFGDNWTRHECKVKENWQKVVKEGDTVLLPGDFSWAMTIKNAYKDFKYLTSLPR